MQCRRDCGGHNILVLLYYSVSIPKRLIMIAIYVVYVLLYVSSVVDVMGELLLFLLYKYLQIVIMYKHL